MSEPMSIILKVKNEPIAVMYYRYGDYTISALDYLRELVPIIRKNRKTRETLLKALIEASSGWFEEDDDSVNTNFPKSKPNSDLDGVIAITDKAQWRAKYNSSSTISVDINTEEVQFDVYTGYDSIKELNADLQDMYSDDLAIPGEKYIPIKAKNVPKHKASLSDFTLDKVKKILKMVQKDVAEASPDIEEYVIKFNSEYCVMKV